MQKITEEMTNASYDISKKVFQNKLTRTEGIEILVNEYDMNVSSASDYFQYFKCMMEGKRITRTGNTYATEYFLKNISKDFGKEYLKNALLALTQHIIYYEDLRKVHMHQIREVLERYSIIIPVTNEDEIEQNKIATIYKNISKSEIINELKNRSNRQKVVRKN